MCQRVIEGWRWPPYLRRWPVQNRLFYSGVLSPLRSLRVLLWGKSWRRPEGCRSPCASGVQFIVHLGRPLSTDKSLTFGPLEGTLCTLLWTFGVLWIMYCKTFVQVLWHRVHAEGAVLCEKVLTNQRGNPHKISKDFLVFARREGPRHDEDIIFTVSELVLKTSSGVVLS